MKSKILQRAGKSEVSSASLGLSAFGIIVLLKLAFVIWLQSRARLHERAYSYVGDDYPQTWPIERPTVLMASDASRRYQFNTSDGIAEWKSLVPGDGVVYLGKEQRPFGVSMMHQLGCLDVLREEIVRPREESRLPGAENDGSNMALARHCLNYIKQMMLCRADSQLEPFWYNNNHGPVDLYGFYECKDWTAVHQAIKLNQGEHLRWKKAV